MTDQRDEIKSSITAFVTVAELGRDPIPSADIEVESLFALHRRPSHLPSGATVLGFWCDGVWLKIGKARTKLNARYTSQHYNPGSARSTLAGSLAKDPHMLPVAGFHPQSVGAWIKNATHRVNILLPTTRQPEPLSRLEAFFHLRRKPRYVW